MNYLSPFISHVFFQLLSFFVADICQIIYNMAKITLVLIAGLFILRCQMNDPDRMVCDQWF